MKIIISERQERLITENLTEENLRKLCYQIWDKQRKMGEEPHLDDIIYDITGIKKETRDDYDMIRPIWYRYNGGYEKLFEKIENEIDNKEYDLVEDEFNVDTKIKVVDIERVGHFIEIMVNIDPRGTIDFHGWDEETDEEYVVNDTIDAAYQEALSNYETGDLMGMLRAVVYDFFYGLLEKYGVPIDVDIDLDNSVLYN